MTAAPKTVLTINGGSSSIKFALFESGNSPQATLTGAIEGIGTPQARFSVMTAAPGESFTRSVAALEFAVAVTTVLDWIEHANIAALIAVGHRIVHGGPHYHQPQRLTREVLIDLGRLTPWDPEHLPGAVLLIEEIGRRFPHLPQFACFDTAFHHDLPRVARALPIPRNYEAQGVRRYGFHGLSYEFIMSELLRTGGLETSRGRIILAHLGNGSSLAAVHQGHSIDTSMGFTPASGVPMGTRSGDLDPGLAWYLARTEQMDARQFNDFANLKCGLLGVSGSSADMHTLLQHEAADPRAAEAVAMYCYQIRKCIGAFTAALGGLDTLVFTGGIGANAAAVRARICDVLGYLGIALDPQRNEANANRISPAAARVAVHVIPANEELVIARAVGRLLALEQDKLEIH